MRRTYDHYTPDEMAAMADGFEKGAKAKQTVADRLAAQGHTTVAETWRRGAQDLREHATAARQGGEYFTDWINGW
ncbi:hypothetical protein [Streptomyces buecherae]|uniref:Uncharacterized protein n=1 Tax=Streptomyces buecherae TaxID=2763006 RepID=A0A7H8NNE9_9ACTN|nr:hypothetical protein [Streptomyces buecherae]QKW55038.1 hypothetical protein HUT08_36525 [Streptomyces buecherae]